MRQKDFHRSSREPKYGDIMDNEKNQEEAEKGVRSRHLMLSVIDAPTCEHKVPTRFTAVLCFGPKEKIEMEQKVDETVRKTIQSIRNMGSTLNMRLPVARQKSEAIRIKAECEKLIEMLGGE